MVDKDVILSKAGSVEKHTSRIKKIISGISLETFIENIDIQDIILFNIQRAVQNCIDIAAHIVSQGNMGVPGSTSELFYSLEENGFLSRSLTEKMVKAVGFRNLIVHEYGKLDLKRAFAISQNDINDLNEFLKAVMQQI